MSQADLVIKALGGPTQASWKLSKLVGRPVSYAAIQGWKSRAKGIPPDMRTIMLLGAETLGIKNNEPVLEYLQPKDAI